MATAVGCRRNTESGGAGAAPRGGVAGAPPTTHFVSDLPRGEWRMAAGDYGNLRYSTLDAINTTNAMNLHVVTTFSTGSRPVAICAAIRSKPWTQ